MGRNAIGRGGATPWGQTQVRCKVWPLCGVRFSARQSRLDPIQAQGKRVPCVAPAETPARAGQPRRPARQAAPSPPSLPRPLRRNPPERPYAGPEDLEPPSPLPLRGTSQRSRHPREANVLAAPVPRPTAGGPPWPGSQISVRSGRSTYPLSWQPQPCRRDPETHGGAVRLYVYHCPGKACQTEQNRSTCSYTCYRATQRHKSFPTPKHLGPRTSQTLPTGAVVFGPQVVPVPARG